jgi:hypothetical protein
MVLVLLVSFFLWAVIGFFLWVPLLIRTILIFSVAVTHAAISGQHADNLREPLRIACGFWIDGFRIISETTFARSGRETRRRPDIRFVRLVGETLWAGCLWLLLVWAWRPTLAHSLLYSLLPSGLDNRFVLVGLVSFMAGGLLGMGVKIQIFR